jgi:ABC-type Fe3+ transport system permease subunit
MAVLVWFTVGVALWHFTVFFPDRFWGGIVGALLGAVTGAMITGAAAQIATGDSVGETGIETVLYAVPGTLIGIGVMYLIGTRHEPDLDPYEAPTGRRA